MKLNSPDTELYLDLSEHPGIDSREISEGIVLGYDAEGHLINGLARQIAVKLVINPELAHATALRGKGPWQIGHTQGIGMALNHRFFDQMGMIRLSASPNF